MQKYNGKKLKNKYDKIPNKVFSKVIARSQSNLGQSETRFWLINCNLKTINLVKPKLGMVRPWSLLPKYRKFIKRISIASMLTG